MRLRQYLRQVAIALIRHDHRRAGLGDQEIRPGDAYIRVEIFLPQYAARLVEQRHRVFQIAVRIKMRVHAAEIALDLFLRQMHGGRDDMARMLAAQLDDIFAQIRLDRHNAVFLEMLIERDFLGDHAFALGHGLGAHIAAELQDNRAGFFRVLGKMNMPAGGFDLVAIGFKIKIKMRQRMVLDRLGRIPQRLKLRQRVNRGAALVDEAGAHKAHGLLQERIGEGLGGVGFEGWGGDLHSVIRLSLQRGGIVRQASERGAPTPNPSPQGGGGLAGAVLTPPPCGEGQGWGRLAPKPALKKCLNRADHQNPMLHLSAPRQSPAHPSSPPAPPPHAAPEPPTPRASASRPCSSDTQDRPPEAGPRRSP